MLKKLIVVFTLMLMSSTAVQAFTFKIATLSSDGSVWMENMRAGAKEISEKTENRVKFKFYPGGVMGGDKNVLRKMKFGQLHGGAMPSSGMAGVYPDIQLYNLVMKFQSFEEVDYARQRMDVLLTEGLDKKGFVSFGFAEMGFAYIMSTTPIVTVADLQQQKVWAPDSNKLAINAFKECSVSPIPLPLRDVLMGLQTGMIDTVTGTPIGALALQWHTKIKYVTELPLSYIFGVFVIDKKSFNKISKQDQQIVRAVMTQVAENIDKQSREDNINAVAALKSQGVMFITVENSAANELKNIMESANKQILTNSGLSEKLVQQLDNNLAEYRANHVQVEVVTK